MSTTTDSARPADPGLEALVTLLHLQGVAADAGQLRHRLGTDKIGAPDMLRCAKDLGLKARAYRTDWSRLANTPLPAIAALRDGGFMVVAKAAEDKVLVQSPQTPRPALMTRAELHRGLGRPADPDDPPRRTVGPHPPLRHHLVPGRDPQISPSPRRGAGRVVLPAALRAGLAAVLPGRHRQGAGTPVLEHARRAGDRPPRDLDVRDRSRHPADLSVRAHHQPHRRRARRAPVPPPAGAADGLFPGAARRRFGGAGARAGEHPQFPHQLGADPGHRPVLHLRLPGGDVLLLAAADLDRDRLVSVLHRDLSGRRRRCSAGGWTRNSDAAPRTRRSWSRA